MREGDPTDCEHGSMLSRHESLMCEDLDGGEIIRALLSSVESSYRCMLVPGPFHSNDTAKIAASRRVGLPLSLHSRLSYTSLTPRVRVGSLVS